MCFRDPRSSKPSTMQNKQELDLVAEADKDYESDLYVSEFDEPMIRSGSSHIFKKTIETNSPPSSMHIGTDQCGWTEAVIQ